MEYPHVFGQQDNLVGIANVPARARKDVAVVMVTPGMLHQAGPSRLHVKLARALAKSRVASFRFDLSGIGESLAVGNSGTSLNRASGEIQAALDCLQEKYGIKQFVLFGLCSGADDSFYTAQQDKRVVGAVLMDGCGYRTPGFHWHRLWNHYVRRALSPRRLRAALLNRMPGSVDAPASMQPGDDIREFPSRDLAAENLQTLVNRNVQMRFVFTGGVANYYNHKGQFARMFSDVDMQGRVTSVFYPQMDHVAILKEDRTMLIEGIVDWIGGAWPESKATRVNRLAEDPHYGARIRRVTVSPAWGI